MAKRCVGCMKMKENSPICEHCGYNEDIPNENHQLPVGTVLQGRYQVGKVLGQGGFGITYIGWDTALETAIAIKEYYPSSLVYRESTQNLTVTCTGSNASDLYAQNLDRFLREARILAKLQNVPGIVRVQNLFADNNTAYIIMEYVDGINLKQYIRMQQRVLTVAETLAVMQPVMRALNKVHESGLVHRDISPDNIMIQKDGSVKLLDFGAARQVEHADVNHDLTRSTQTILKHGFAPIEQYSRRGNLGPWTDVYALCTTIYYCLTGKVATAAPERILGDDNVNWNQIPELSDRQIAVLKKGMSSAPENRIQSMKELDEGLYTQSEPTLLTSRRELQNHISYSDSLIFSDNVIDHTIPTAFGRINSNFQKLLPGTCPNCIKKKKQHPICEHCNQHENEQNSPHQLSVGTVLQNRYVVGRVQYQYDLGIVYTGWDISLKTPITIKEFYPFNIVTRDCAFSLQVSCRNSASEKAFLSRREFFLKESQVLSTLTRFPSIIQVYSIFSENNTIYVIREYADSTDLHQYIQTIKRNLTVDETLRIMKPVLEALNAIHKTNLCHGDVSPDTILIQKNGATRLLETSTSLPINPEENSGPFSLNPYMPLEKYKKHAFLGSWSDVYSVCATMYYCMTGKVPANASERILGYDNVNWRQIPGLNEHQITVLKKGMEPVAENRIQRIEELERGLYSLYLSVVRSSTPTFWDNKNSNFQKLLPDTCPNCMKKKTQYPVCEHCGHNENTPNNAHSLPVGTVLKNQYIIGKVLGEGGSKKLYISWDINMENPVIIHEYFPFGEATRNPNYSLDICFANKTGFDYQKSRDNFLYEYRILAKLSDIPGLVRVHNMFRDNNTDYVVMGYAEGQTLDKYIETQKSSITFDELLSLLWPVFYALINLHKINHIHMDIHPHNIIVQSDGQTKLVGFSIVSDYLKQDRDCVVFHRTTTPIEQHQRRGNLGPWTDVYALCATLYYCITRSYPQDPVERSIVDKTNWNNMPGLTKRQLTVLNKGMALKPEDRINSIQELWDSLHGESIENAGQNNTKEKSPSFGKFLSWFNEKRNKSGV